MRRIRTLYAIARKSGVRSALHLVRTFSHNLAERGGALLRAPVQISSALPPPEGGRHTIDLDPFRVFQPDGKFIERYARLDVGDAANVEHFSPQRLHYKGVPYAKYMGEWHFHPGRIGGRLARWRLNDPILPKVAERVRELFTELPNGGAALYYPKSFRLTRLQTREYLYSAIAQAQLLAGYSRLAHAAAVPEPERIRWRDFAVYLAKSLEFPFEHGGVNMEGRVLLEAPNFRSAPEIILNGWMDALIHLHDYISEFGIANSLQELFEANVRALSHLLPQFDDEHLRLSKYSNLSPYRARVRFRDSIRDSPRVCLTYCATVSGFSDYRIDDLRRHGDGGACFFENKILRQRDGRMDMLISSSSLYDVEIEVDAAATRLELDSHPYRIWSAPSGEVAKAAIHVAPAEHQATGNTVFRFSPSGLLMTGQPTDFAKGFNFYHTYHVCALFELCAMTRDDATRKVLRDFASKWLDYIKVPSARIAKQRLSFSDPEKVLKQVSNGRGRRSGPSFEELVRSAAAI